MEGVTTDARRLVPRTDVVLSDPRLRGGGGSGSARPVVKAAVAGRPAAGPGPGDLAPGRGSPRRPSRPLPGTAGRAGGPVLNATGGRACTPISAGRRSPTRPAAAIVRGRRATPTSSSTCAPGRRARRGAYGDGRARGGGFPRPGGVHVVNNGAARPWCSPADGGWPRAGRSSSVVARMVEIGDGFRLPDLLGVDRGRGCARSAPPTAPRSGTTKRR